MARFFDEIAGIAERGPRFFVPGHKGNPAAIPALGDALRLDLTEVDGAGDLSCPTGALAESEALMARCFGSGATLYSTAGSTSCVMAMLALFCGEGGQVVMARGCHVSAIRAMALMDITPHWVALENGYATPTAIDAALTQNHACVVYITSPDYYGRMADVAAIAAVCRRHSAVLLVDNAHGAYLRFYEQDLHPLSLGADATADSAHKTLPCITPAALLHLRDAALAQKARQMLNLFCSTSPSYLVLESLDLAATLLATAPPDFTGAARRLKQAAGGFAAVVAECDDPLRLCLAPACAGLDAGRFHQALLAHGIAPEYCDGQSIILMASPCNTEADFEQLYHALLHFKQDNALILGLCCDNSAISHATHSCEIPNAACSIRSALFAQKRTVPVGESDGCVCACLAAPCPPGVPLVVPGEVMTKPLTAQLAAGGILSLDVL